MKTVTGNALEHICDLLCHTCLHFPFLKKIDTLILVDMLMHAYLMHNKKFPC